MNNLKQMDKTLKPNGISHTVMPEDPAKDYNAWMEHITAKSIERDADEFKRQLDWLWQCHWFRSPEEADRFKTQYDRIWKKFKKEIQNHAK